MPADKTLAIVLRVIDFSESSCVVTLFTRDFGKLTGLAKGARRPKGPFASDGDNRQGWGWSVNVTTSLTRQEPPPEETGGTRVEQ